MVLRFWGPWDVQVLFVFGIGTSSRAGRGQPCPRRGQCCAVAGAVEAGVWGVWWPPSQE